MITTKEELRVFIKADAVANGRKSTRPRVFGDVLWKYQVLLRKTDYLMNSSKKNPLNVIPYAFAKIRFHNLSVKLGFSIPVEVRIGKGLSIAHYGLLTISKSAMLGENCRIHEGVCIGSTNGEKESAKIGNNVFIGSGAKIIGDITIADDVAIAAGAVVVSSIDEPGTTWGGVPARKISHSDSHRNLPGFGIK
jgi:serine O-acetyltransferase